MNSTYAAARRGKLGEILGDRSTPREERIERVARFVEEEVRNAFSRGVRHSRMSRSKPPAVSSRLVREDVEVDMESDAAGEDEL